MPGILDVPFLQRKGNIKKKDELDFIEEAT